MDHRLQIDLKNHRLQTLFHIHISCTSIGSITYFILMCIKSYLKLASISYTWQVIEGLCKVKTIIISYLWLFLINDKKDKDFMNYLSTHISCTSCMGPCYSLMVDEVSDNRTIKHLAICTRYIDPDGDVKTAFMTDTELPTGTANVITNTVVDKLKEQNLDVNYLSGFASDGAAVFLGNKSGVAKQLKDMNPSLITTHCKDHRLALACKSSFEAIPLMRKVDDTLNRLHKYSCNNTASLKNVQTAFKEKPISMKQAKHHRWLSHEQAVSSLVRSYKSVVVDLESSTISSDPVGHGLI